MRAASVILLLAFVLFIHDVYSGPLSKNPFADVEGNWPKVSAFVCFVGLSFWTFVLPFYQRQISTLKGFLH